MSLTDDFLSAQLGVQWLPVAIARFGDADLRGWWRSHGMDSTGEYVLSDLFPRTWEVAGAELSVLSAAKRHHDALPGRGDVLHLFGEPFPAFRQAMAWLAELKTGGDISPLGELRKWSLSTADAELGSVLGEPVSGERIAGTLRLGQLASDSVSDPRAIMLAARALASAYFGQGSDLVVPYFDLV